MTTEEGSWKTENPKTKLEVEELKTLKDVVDNGWVDDYQIVPKELTHSATQTEVVEVKELKTEVERIKNSCFRNDVFDLQTFGLEMLKFFEMEIEK